MANHEVWDGLRWRKSQGVDPTKAVRVTVHFETVLPIEAGLDAVKLFKNADGTTRQYISSSAIIGLDDFLQGCAEEAGGGDGGDTKEIIDVDYAEFDKMVAEHLADGSWDEEDVAYERHEWLEDNYLKDS